MPAPSGRPRGQDVERAVHRHAPRVEAVVVDDVDLLRPPLRRRVAVGDEGDARARDARVLGQRHDVVGRAVREDPRVVGAARVAAGEHRLPGVHEVDAGLDGQLAARGHLGARDHEDLRADALPVLHVRRVRVLRGDGREQAVRHELEQALEAQVVAQHLADRPARGRARLVAAPRHAVGHREAGRRAADDDLLDARLCGCGRRLCGRAVRCRQGRRGPPSPTRGPPPARRERRPARRRGSASPRYDVGRKRAWIVRGF